MAEKFLVVSIHDFKMNIAKYLRALRRGDYCGIVLRRYGRRIAFVSPYGVGKK